MTPREYARKIHSMIYHSAFGDGWKSYLRHRSIQIVNELKERKAVPQKKDDNFWDKVIDILEKDLK